MIARFQIAPGRATINLVIIGCTAIMLWTKSWQLKKSQIGIIILFGIIALFASLLFKEDYAGGEYLIHFHRGYPFSWRDGGISTWPGLQYGFTVSEYIARNPKLIQWTVDLPALVIDTFFWLNSSIILILFGFGIYQKVRRSTFMT